jgi:hypothetical protein
MGGSLWPIAFVKSTLSYLPEEFFVGIKAMCRSIFACKEYSFKVYGTKSEEFDLDTTPHSEAALK